MIERRIPPLVFLPLALTAFAANSLLCRAALGAGAVDPFSFTTLRLGGGAALLFLLQAGRGGLPRAARDARASAALYVYALLFSVAYVQMATGTGALLLFGTVQLTMLGASLWRGTRPTRRGWTGLGLAVLGLVWLLLPGLAAPPMLAALAMAGAGVAWGAYSLCGASRGGDPIARTAWNFILAAPVAGAVGLLVRTDVVLTTQGVALALMSGAVTSGLGYVAWYRALPGLSAIGASSAQLCVPLLAALGGILWLGEPFTMRLAVSSALILGGLALVLLPSGSVAKIFMVRARPR